MISIRGRMVRLAGSALLASVGMTLATAPAAHAAAGKDIGLNTQCVGRFIENDGSTGGEVPPGTPFPLPITVARVGGPTEVNAGTAFKGVSGTVAVPIPPIVDTGISGVGIDEDEDGTGDGKVPVFAAADIIETIQVNGAASVGTPTVGSGGNVLNASATKVGSNQIKVRFDGSRTSPGGQAGEFQVPPAYDHAVPGDEKDFPASHSFLTPTINIPVTAGAPGTAITFTIVGSHEFHDSLFNSFKIDSFVDAFGNGLGIMVRAFCDPAATVLGKVQVVTPPPPGAPDAVADVAQTDENKALTIDVLANDTPNAQLAIDKDSLAITTNGAHGAAKVNADHTITYTPANGFIGSDSFKYKLCSVPEAPTTTTTGEIILTSVATAVAEKCDTATVTVTVLEAQDVAEQPASGPATTLAAAAELPRTGSSSTPLALLGFGLCAAGLAAAGVAKSRRRSTVS
jgi:LPXTG-motif cell wall-anchored protein